MFLFLFFLIAVPAQQLHFQVQTVPETCQKGSANLHASGQYDSLYYQWSNGIINQPLVQSLRAGEYWVVAYAMTKHDTTKVIRDTTIHFIIEKEPCPLLIPKYFSPNGDNYNDLFLIGNIESYPNFELFIYNKWGQRVHHQVGNYIPWDGRWLGSDLADGAYYYVIYFDKGNNAEFVKGDVTIIR